MTNRFYTAFDAETYGGERKVDYRTPFQIDRDRIIHSHAFRKLQSKTQVFLSGEYDFYRTRLTHSMEVAQVGRSICQYLRSRGGPMRDDFHVDGDLVEAVCLSHDLGHPPFGHRRCTCSPRRCTRTNPASAACSRRGRSSMAC
jgi:dGTPase